MMDIDTNVHTLPCSLAFSTISEYVSEAARKGLKGFVISNHGPTLRGAMPLEYFSEYILAIPSAIQGIYTYTGSQTNIRSTATRDIDINSDIQKKIQWNSAYYNPVSNFSQVSYELMTNTLINIFQESSLASLIDVYQIDADYNQIVKACRERGKVIEFTEAGLKSELHTRNACQLMRICQREGCLVSISSGAKLSIEIGEANTLYEMAREANIDSSLILNNDITKFEAYIAKIHNEAKEDICEKHYIPGKKFS